jgi:hypothetical protein
MGTKAEKDPRVIKLFSQEILKKLKEASILV